MSRAGTKVWRAGGQGPSPLAYGRLSHDALALSLEGFAYYGQRHRDALAELPEFDPNLLDEALVVANRLREQSSLKLSNDEGEPAAPRTIVMRASAGRHPSAAPASR